MLSKIKQCLIITLACVLIVLGFLVFWLPIPFGALMMILGVCLLVSYSKSFTDLLKALRANYPKFNDCLSRHEAKLPKIILRTLIKTRPLEASH